jgi:hypothetical protein
MKISDENQKLADEIDKKNKILTSTTDLSKRVPPKKRSKSEAYVTKAGKK